MTRLLLPLLLALAPAMPSAGQQSSGTQGPTLEARDQEIVRAWVQRWNALGGDTASAIDELVALYSPDALHITGPTADQRGTATYRGHDGIRVLAARVARSQERLSYRIETETANEQTAELFHVATGPWKGASVAVQLVAVYSERSGGKRWVVPAGAFFQLSEGKIRRLRVYYADAEKAEVEAEQVRKRPK
jgi:hypothetical protein